MGNLTCLHSLLPGLEFGFRFLELGDSDSGIFSFSLWPQNWVGMQA